MGQFDMTEYNFTSMGMFWLPLAMLKDENYFIIADGCEPMSQLAVLLIT